MEPILANFLHGVRQSRGLSIREAARRAGIAASTLSRWEAGSNSPCLPELEALLRALNVTPDQIECTLGLVHSARAVRRLVWEPDKLDAGPHAPTTGDLLLAMRGRAGLSCAEVAECVGVTPSTVSRWERGAFSPGPAALARMCGLLCANRGETLVLKEGCGLLSTTEENPSAVTEECEALLRDLERQAGLDGLPCGDLDFLTLECRLALVSRRHPVAEGVLAAAKTAYAVWLADHGRFSEAALQARNALALMENRRVSSVIRLAAVTKVAQERAQRCNPAAPLNGVQILLQYVPVFAQDPALATWLYRDIAAGLEEGGLYDQALQYIDLAELAAEDAESASHTLLAGWIRASILTTADRADEALPLLPTTSLSPIQQVLNGFRWAEAYIALGERSSADSALRKAVTVIEEHSFRHLLPQADYLAELL